MNKIVLIPGDGVGPELIDATRKCIEATGVRIDWIEKYAGAVSLEKEGELLPQHVLDEIQAVGKALKGPIITPVGKGFRSVNVTLRQALDLYACVRPCRMLPGISNPLAGNKKTDIVIVRENTEDLYAGVEFESGEDATKCFISHMNEQIKASGGKTISEDAGISIKPITKKATERIAHHAFQYAQKHGRKKVSCVTKSNIMKFSDGLFMQTAEEVAKQYPDITYDHVLVDALCMKLVQMPEVFDILLLPNLYGDIVSDVGAGLVGGLGVAPGANIGTNVVIYEATHGAAPEFAGKDMLNPTALILCGIMLLKDIDEMDAADSLEQALFRVLGEGKNVTFDLLPDDKKTQAVSTSKMTEAIIAYL